MNNIWTMIISFLSYFNIFKKPDIEPVVEGIDKLDDVVVNKTTYSYMKNYLIHNDPNVMSEWDYLIRLHIR